MRYKHRYAFHESNKKIIRFLKVNSIEVERDSSYIIVFSMYEDEKKFLLVVNKMKMLGITPIISTEFTKEEIEDATWFSMRCVWLNGYPQPIDSFEDTIYDKSGVACMCNKHQVQDFRISREVKWGNKRNFCFLNWVYDEIFVNAEKIDLFENSGIKGYHFQDVRIHKQNHVSNTCKQIVVDSIMSDDLDLDKTATREIYRCPDCHENKVILLGKEEHYKRDAFINLDVDIIKSKTVFGMEHLACRSIYISKRFYTFLIKNKLDKNIIFKPISLD